MILSSVLAFLAIGIDLHEEVQAVILCQTFVHENQYFCFDLVINSVSSLNRVTVLSTAMLLIINTFFFFISSISWLRRCFDKHPDGYFSQVLFVYAL